MTAAELDLHDIQGDALIGLQKRVERFAFFQITELARFKAAARAYLVPRVTNAWAAQQRERLIPEPHRRRGHAREPWLGLNFGLTRHGMTRVLGANRPQMDTGFERGADDPRTITMLADPPITTWVAGFASERIDGVFILTGPNRSFVAFHGNAIRERFHDAVKIVFSEDGAVRPGRERGHEHFGFLDSVSQPGIRGVDRPSRPGVAPDQALPGQDLVWPGEFVIGYPAQDPRDPAEPGPVAPLPAPWAKNGSYMVFRRLEQRVPEFWAFVAAQATRLGLYRELLAARMVGRWQSGAPLELAPLKDNPLIDGHARRDNDFGYADDPFQRACPYAAHIRKVNPRDDVPAQRAEMLRHRIIRRGIPFGPEVMPRETRTAVSRGLLFVCYQASIERQFEYIQMRANDPGFPTGKRRPDSGVPVPPGWDPIIGQAMGGGPRFMDEPVPNWPLGNRRSRLDLPEQFVIPTAAAYFFMPSLTALRNVLT